MSVFIPLLQFDPLLLLTQVQKALGAVENESDPSIWALKIIVLVAIGAVGYMGKLLLERPRPAEVSRLRETNDKLRTKIDRMDDDARETERKLNKTKMRCIELRLLLRHENIDVPDIEAI